jgi:propane monooxygenase small subunit
MDLAVFDATAGKTHWLEDPIWQGTREATESIMGADDYLEPQASPHFIRWQKSQ